MAEKRDEVDYVEVKAEDILTERTASWALFTRGIVWSVAAVAVVLVGLLLFFG